MTPIWPARVRSKIETRTAGQIKRKHGHEFSPDCLAFALRNVAREWRSGELGVLMVALVVAVGSVTSVGFFTSRMELAMQAQGGAAACGWTWP